jgi:hypothetical protein
MISVWDDKKFEALRIDLWTKDMPVDQMKMFFIKFSFLLVILTKEQLAKMMWQIKFKNLQRNLH